MSGNNPPPPRKGAYTKHISALHKDQYIRIQAKNVQETELLEDIHGYMKKRAVIEKTYAESLLKLTTQFQSHKNLPIPDLGAKPVNPQQQEDQPPQDPTAGFSATANNEEGLMVNKQTEKLTV